jgi:hypothetical protein
MVTIDAWLEINADNVRSPLKELEKAGRFIDPAILLE